MTYGESDDVDACLMLITCLMTSRVQSFYSELTTYWHATFRIYKIAWKYRKTANI